MLVLRALQDFFLDGEPNPDGRIEDYLREPVEIENLDDHDFVYVDSHHNGTELRIPAKSRRRATLSDAYKILGDPASYGEVRSDSARIHRGYFGLHDTPPTSADIERYLRMKEIGMPNIEQFDPSNTPALPNLRVYDIGGDLVGGYFEDDPGPCWPLYVDTYTPASVPTLTERLKVLEERATQGAVAAEL